MAVIQRQSTDPATSISFGLRRRIWHLDVAYQDAGNGHIYRGHRRTLCCLPGIISLIIMCIGIIFK